MAEGLLRAEENLEQKRKQRLDEEQRAREQQRQADLERLETVDRLQEAAGPRVPVSDNTLRVEFVGPKAVGGGQASAEEVKHWERMLAWMLPRIVREIARSKSITVTQRPR